jgi:hypothetical protein
LHLDPSNLAVKVEPAIVQCACLPSCHIMKVVKALSQLSNVDLVCLPTHVPCLQSLLDMSGMANQARVAQLTPMECASQLRLFATQVGAWVGREGAAPHLQ